MAALHDVAVAAGGVSDPDRLANLVVERARQVAGGEGAVLRWYEPATNSFLLLASVGTGGDMEALIAANAPTAISGAFKSGHPVVMNDYKTSGRTTTWGRTHNISAQVAVPLLVDGRPVGTLAVLSYADHQYDTADALFLSLLAAIIAPALESARLASEVKRQARSVAQIYEALPVMVVVYGRDGKAIQHNSAAETALGRERLVGVRERAIPLVREDGTPIPADERPFARALATKAPVRGTIVGYGGPAFRWAYVDAVPVFDENGEVEVVVTSSIDITRLKAAEDKQRHDAERLHALIELQTQLGALDFDASQAIRLVAERALDLTGGPGAAVQMIEGDEVVIAACAGFGAELEGKRLPRKGNPVNGCAEEGVSQWTADTLVDDRCGKEIFETAGIRSLLMAPIRHEGTVIGGLQLQSPRRGDFPEGTPATLELLAGFAGEAIGRARAAEALRESEQLFSGAFLASGVAMAMTDMRGVVERVNPAYTELFGYSQEEAVGLDGRSLVVADDLGATVSALSRLPTAEDSTVISAKLRVIHKDGHHIWARVTTSLIRKEGVPPYILTHVVDLTEERKAEAILRSEQQRLGEIIEAQRDIAAAEHDLQGMLSALAERVVRLVGDCGVAVMLPEGDELAVTAIAGMNELEVGFRLPINASLAGACFRSGNTQRSADVQKDPRAHRKTAREFRFGAAIATPLVNNGEVIGVVQLMSRRPNAFDETDARTLEMVAAFTAAALERARTTRRIKASEQRTRAVMESAPDPIVVFDVDGNIVDFNPAAERAFLRPRAEAVGRSAMILLASKHLEAFKRWNRAGLEANSAEYAGKMFEATGLRSDGTEFPIEIAVTDLPEEARLVACFIRDLTMRDRLKESRERLEAVVSSAHVILLAADTRGVITLAQGSGLAVLDVTPEAMIGRDMAEVLQGRPEAVEFLARAIAGEPVTGLIHLTDPDRYLEGVLSPIRNSEGAVAGVSVILTDVTDRLLQAERQASLLAALSDVGEGLVTTQDGRYVSSNEAYLEMTGYTEAELRALPTLYDLVPADEREEFQRTLAARYRSGDPVIHVDSALVRKDGRRRDIEASIIRVTEDGVARLVTIVRDVTDQRRAEEAQRDSEAKSRLMAMMNHEVRTPLNSILGFAQLLTDPRVGELTEKQRRYVGNIKAAGDHLLQLANDSLDMAKLDAGRAGMVLTIVAVDSVVPQAVEQVRPMASAQSLTLNTELPAGINARADARHLTQVLLNLLSNAIRHTHAGTITVSARKDGDSVAIAVADTGDGISREDLAKIFEEFFQGGNHAPGGIGLGLSISRRLVHLMGGSISVESELGKGSTFTVRLPASR
ncbi:MAG TPA: PAS domain S-box protein [Candidatus Dormibacteraeota bacterium]|nr:PAS domain S-box protein [Candidatus Dormibacteraeota bacterium]